MSFLPVAFLVAFLLFFGVVVLIEFWLYLLGLSWVLTLAGTAVLVLKFHARIVNLARRVMR